MLEGLSLSPVLQGGLIVAGIVVVSTALYIGYAVIERFLAKWMHNALTDE